ncbi:hypothetical protein HanHA300_Chr00c0056g0700121 [Helianthus annuus]|nr:hypothetical protein HanHA300_Chr00c0056g0700121 [Helianthus annuus]KAJ0671421.1 hypothetical protein HanOQP8_Chr13g0485281 [Helianthus annuus]
MFMVSPKNQFSPKFPLFPALAHKIPHPLEGMKPLVSGLCMRHHQQRNQRELSIPSISNSFMT